MIDEELEFSVSQYIDGNLPDAQRRVLELRLEQDAEARALLVQYRQLSAQIVADPLPDVQWHLLARSISSAIDQAEEQAQRAYRLPAWLRLAAGPLSLAASLLIIAGVGIRLYLLRSHHVPAPSVAVTHPPATPAAASQLAMIVIGPHDSGHATGPALVQVSIGPSSPGADEPTVVQYSDDLVSRPSHVAIASGVTPAHDTIELPNDMQ